MRRRTFITLLGGAAAWPLAARAQQAAKMRRIGVLTPFSANDPEAKARVHALALALQQLGWTDGDNLRIEIRWAGGDASRMRRDAAELVALAPDLIVTTGSATTALALQEDPRHTDRIRAGRRPRRGRLRRELAAPGRQRHRLYRL